LWWWYLPLPSMCKLLIVGALRRLQQWQPLHLFIYLFFLLVFPIDFIVCFK
jgi:hypothetical protein